MEVPTEPGELIDRRRLEECERAIRAAELASQWNRDLAEVLLERAERLISAAKREDWEAPRG